MSDDTMTAIAELDRLLNEPPCNEDKMGVREYRHLVYPAFQRLVAYIERQAEELAAAIDAARKG